MHVHGHRAIVLGASVAGLATAQVLARYFREVTIVERDALEAEDASVSRKGVPQGNQGHGILTRGQRLLSEYFPGLVPELVSAGAQLTDTTRDFLWFQFGGWKLRVESGLEGVVVSRPLLEVNMRRRVRAQPNVTLLSEHEGLEPCLDQAGRRVHGLTVRKLQSGEERTLPADLVVDTTGRASRAPKWLAANGFGDVAESVLSVEVGYTTAFFERRERDLYGAKGAMLASTPPASTRSCAIFGVERNRWQVTLLGALRDHPPAELAGFREFARSLPTPEIFDLVRDREPLSPFYQCRFPANRRRHYERLRRFPSGLLLLGDSLCCFNPMYGQGITVALLEAEALDRCLQSGTERVAQRFFRTASKLIDMPWTITTGEDRRYARSPERTPPGEALLHRYLERVHHTARHDPVVLRRFFEVVTLLAPPNALMSPSMVWRVLFPSPRSRARAPGLQLAEPS